MGFWEKVIELLVGIVGQSVVDAWQQDSDVDSDIEFLSLALTYARLLIERSECWCLPEGNPIDMLLPQLKDAVYEAESVVNESVYQGLKNEVEKSSSGTTFFMNWMGNFPSSVKKAFDRLDKLSSKMEKTCTSRGIPEHPSQFSGTARPIKTRSLYKAKTTKVYGRVEELNEVLSWMGVPRSGGRRRSKKANLSNLDSDKSSDSAKKKANVSVLSIVGMGGVGKTTLAQMVCNDERVKSYFNVIVWVRVSDNFDPISLTKKIIKGVTKKSCDDLTNLDALQRNLEETLNSKKFLLVLDDVWSKDWQRLAGPMKGACEGSIVMVTTRSQECVEVAGTGIDSRGVVNLKGLEEDIYWELFKSHIFVSGANSEKYPELEVIGKEICGRLEGSPLAARKIGGLLRQNIDARNWMNIKDSKIWQLKQEEHDILPILQLCYHCLPSHLKKCFSYCALYPKGFKFTKGELTNLWIMQGFINLPQQLEVHWNEPFIREAEVYFHDLIQRCFFQKVDGSYSHEYVIHDLMHDVCQSITKDECLCLEYGDLKTSVTNRNNIRHISIFKKRIKPEEQNKLCEYKKLLSVRVSPRSSCCITVINYWCKKLTSICSLSLSRCKIRKLPENIGNLKHLQYLDISFTSIEVLPQSFCNLYNLVYLNMEHCSQIKTFPEGFNNLANLRFFYLPAERVILIGHMENLAKEIEYKYMMLSVGHNGKIENLKYMNKLSGSLTIKYLEKVPNKEAAEEAYLKNKSLVSKLDLSWRDRDCTSDQSLVDELHDEEVLQGLCPHPNLKVFKISNYAGRTLPSWFKKELCPNLTKIHIKRCKRLTNLEDCLQPNNFPLLKCIKIVSVENLLSLPVESFGRFVFLEKLNISKCPKLICSKAMVLPPSIKKLKLKSCGDITRKSILSCLQNLTSLEFLSIENCGMLISKSPNAFWIENYAELLSIGDLKFLTSLRTLHIRNCSYLVSFPAKTSNLKSLRWLVVDGCAGLQSLGGLDFLTSLWFLQIENCPDLVSIPVETTSNLKSLKILYVRYCAELHSLGGLKFLASLEQLYIFNCPKLAETGGRDIQDMLPSELLAKFPSESQGNETLEKV